MLVIKKRYRPIVFENQSIIIISKGNKIFRYSLTTDEIKYLAKVSLSLKIWFSSINLLFSRIFRSGIRNGVVFDGSFYFTYDACIYYIPLLNTGSIPPKVIFKFDKGKSLLHFSVVDEKLANDTGFDPGVYFGEYFSNQSKSKVSIYKIGKERKVNCLYTFEQGQINHIHNIVFDGYRRCAWILCGDFGNAAGIWRTDDNFTSVSCVVRGQQETRSCIAFALEDGLLYATDSQLEPNSIRLLRTDGPNVSSIPLFTINGPCIYGTELINGFVFTTATEPFVDSAKLSLKDFFRIKPGPGILSNRSVVYHVSKELRIRELFSNEKDRWPYYLAQFGNICLPSGNKYSSYLASFSIANKVNDQCMEIREITIT